MYHVITTECPSCGAVRAVVVEYYPNTSLAPRLVRVEPHLEPPIRVESVPGSKGVYRVTGGQG